MSREVRIVFWLVALIALGFIIKVLNDVLMPFVVGMAIAYFFDPAADKLERMGLSRTVATSIILLGFFVAAIGIVVLIFPALQKQIAAFIKLIPAVVDRVQVLAGPCRKLCRYSVQRCNQRRGFGLEWRACRPQPFIAAADHTIGGILSAPRLG